MKIIANQSILHNNVTNCTFIASELDEEVQTGTREKDSHIEWMGNLNLPAPSQSRIAELEAENAKLREALKQIEYNSLITINAAALNKEGISEFRTLNHVHKVAEQALKGKEAKGE